MTVLDASSPGAIARAADAIRKGGIAAFPTETVYGLGARMGDRVARARLARIKGREGKKPFQALVSSRRAALRMCGRLPVCARKLAGAFWPGPLTLVVKGRNGRWLGLRVPDHPVAAALLRRCGGALVATSANRSGEKDALTAAEVISALGDRVDVVLDGGAAQRRKPSTVVKCDDESWEILREGAIRRAAIRRLLKRPIRPVRLIGRIGRVKKGGWMKIAAGWDHRGRVFREKLAQAIRRLGHEFVPMGATTDEPSDYPDFAFRVAEAVGRGEADRGVLVCGTGIGMSIAANKVEGIRAGVVYDERSARVSRSHNDANVLCLGEDTVKGPLVDSILRIWLETPAEAGRHQRRVGKITEYERQRSAARKRAET